MAEDPWGGLNVTITGGPKEDTWGGLDVKVTGSKLGGRGRPIQKQHPGLSASDRAILMNFAAQPEVMERELTQRGFEFAPYKHPGTGASHYSIRRPGETEWRVIDPEPYPQRLGPTEEPSPRISDNIFSGIKERGGEVLKDIGDILYDIPALGLQVAGEAIGAGLGASRGPTGAVPGYLAGGTIGTGVAEVGREVLGEAFGVEKSLGEHASGALENTAYGSLGTLVGLGVPGPQTIVRRTMGDTVGEAVERGVPQALKYPHQQEKKLVRSLLGDRSGRMKEVRPVRETRLAETAELEKDLSQRQFRDLKSAKRWVSENRGRAILAYQKAKETDRIATGALERESAEASGRLYRAEKELSEAEIRARPKEHISTAPKPPNETVRELESMTHGGFPRVKKARGKAIEEGIPIGIEGASARYRSALAKGAARPMGAVGEAAEQLAIASKGAPIKISFRKKDGTVTSRWLSSSPRPEAREAELVLGTRAPRTPQGGTRAFIDLSKSEKGEKAWINVNMDNVEEFSFAGRTWTREELEREGAKILEPHLTQVKKAVREGVGEVQETVEREAEKRAAEIDPRFRQKFDEEMARKGEIEKNLSDRRRTEGARDTARRGETAGEVGHIRETGRLLKNRIPENIGARRVEGIRKIHQRNPKPPPTTPQRSALQDALLRAGGVRKGGKSPLRRGSFMNPLILGGVGAGAGGPTGKIVGGALVGTRLSFLAGRVLEWFNEMGHREFFRAPPQLRKILRAASKYGPEAARRYIELQLKEFPELVEWIEGSIEN